MSCAESIFRQSCMFKPVVMLTFFSQIFIILVNSFGFMASETFENSHSKSSEQRFSWKGLTDGVAFKL